LLRSVTVNGGQKVEDYGYAYDGNGNVTGTTDGVRPDLSTTYQYDEMGQLVAMLDGFGNPIEHYAYDSVGNLVQKGALVQTYGPGGRPHAVASSAGSTYG